MGVYHLMGLGRSPGAITGPITYLAHRYQRWNQDDKAFFAGSGEAQHREQGEKTGDIQALVFFTTKEVLAAYDENSRKQFLSYHYIDNRAGFLEDRSPEDGKPMKEILSTLLKKELPAISGGRTECELFWCEIERQDINLTYQRVVRIVTALSSVGGQGKEMWVNLTGGNNVVNFALQLAAALSGEVARLYYVQAKNRTAEKSIRYTSEEDYWVDLPVMPLALSRLNHAVLEILQDQPGISEQRLFGLLVERYWDLMRGVDSETLRELYLKPMWKQQLIANVDGGYVIGSQWTVIQPYENILEIMRDQAVTIEQLSTQEEWIDQEILPLN